MAAPVPALAQLASSALSPAHSFELPVSCQLLTALTCCSNQVNISDRKTPEKSFKPCSAQALSEALVDRGFVKKRNNVGQAWQRGIRAAVLSRLPRRRFRSRANTAEAIALHC
jgi:hypothetical protein